LIAAQNALKNNPPAAYKVQRKGQVIDASQRLEIYNKLRGKGGSGGGKKK
jgi:hypothetical protein